MASCSSSREPTTDMPPVKASYEALPRELKLKILRFCRGNGSVSERRDLINLCNIAQAGETKFGHLSIRILVVEDVGTTQWEHSASRPRISDSILRNVLLSSPMRPVRCRLAGDDSRYNLRPHHLTTSASQYFGISEPQDLGISSSHPNSINMNEKQFRRILAHNATTN
ncbi:hypothetical protein DM02DRAFT_660586 [Periconia macrospinosa]|uniref:Uncharacterized protein n=1 Tax=Periconia macrospinosa TaxID=97972 RepID=A0A2V1DCM9_9PLEO|nr:hypothetical protein DM02DRAFT_660586 [Periconia macrospinosa]